MMNFFSKIFSLLRLGFIQPSARRSGQPAPFLFLILFFISCTTTNIYIVRHTEKSTEPANNPHLTQQGVQRADDLKELLKNKNIQTIFSTNTNRTVETAQSLSKEINIPIQYYKPDTVKKIIQQLIAQKKNSLIIGHSNTIIPIFDSLNLFHYKKSIPDYEYDNLFIIKARNNKIKLIETKYGAASIVDSSKMIMK